VDAAVDAACAPVAAVGVTRVAVATRAPPKAPLAGIRGWSSWVLVTAALPKALIAGAGARLFAVVAGVLGVVGAAARGVEVRAVSAESGAAVGVGVWVCVCVRVSEFGTPCVAAVRLWAQVCRV